jgi:signal transduction histidine kinase
MPANVDEVSLGELQQQLVASQRQAVLGSLSGIIAHEYNNLMTPVVARARDALARDDVVAMRKALTTTLKQTEQALEFTRQLLEVAREDELRIEACPLADLVEGAVACAVRPLAKDQIELELDIPSELRVCAQPVLFKQLILNLVLNARAAMEGQPGALSVRACREGDTVVMAIRDSGIGMSQKTIDEVINPFLADEASTPAGEAGVVGLGLTACRAIARQHGAAIRASANDDRGCTFHLRWPAA